MKAAHEDSKFLFESMSLSPAPLKRVHRSFHGNKAIAIPLVNFTAVHDLNKRRRYSLTVICSSQNFLSFVDYLKANSVSRFCSVKWKNGRYNVTELSIARQRLVKTHFRDKLERSIDKQRSVNTA
jgi:hypothetical protein